MVDTRFIRVVEILGEGKCPVAITFHEGLPNVDLLHPQEGATLLIYGDLMVKMDEKVVALFTKTLHHRNMSAIFLSQNLFYQGKGTRDMSLNPHYIVCFKDPRDRAQILHLSRQVRPENSKALQKAYTDATREPPGYLVMDFKQSTPDEYRVRTKIFPSDEHNYVYVLNKKPAK